MIVVDDPTKVEYNKDLKRRDSGGNERIRKWENKRVGKMRNCGKMRNEKVVENEKIVELGADRS